ncbi:MAG: hypothetical protein CPDRYMAC_6502 [uncultured Paraburkholderia sp.]|nr:MAG: hypothetical protein CPDRYDRY_6427 [uncultured Paraburkholderia sp.]CAH2944580.1 MAG: hypothetical protein CPDRYMAC_6502 [uncultured Paraburkholderia sp.]
MVRPLRDAASRARALRRTVQPNSARWPADQREQLILTRLRENGRVLASELAAELQTSEHTVRRPPCACAKPWTVRRGSRRPP